MTRMYSDIGTLMIFRLLMRSSATASPSGRENSSVKKKIISVLPKPSFMESTSFINASKLLKYLMKASGNVNLERNNHMKRMPFGILYFAWFRKTAAKRNGR